MEKYYGKGDNVGGIVGNCVNGIIINSNYNIGAINGEKNIIGGIAGTVQKKCEITNNYNVSNIRGNDNSNYLAGIIGFSDSSLVKNCYNIGNIKGGDYAVNGILGNSNDNSNSIDNAIIWKIR